MESNDIMDFTKIMCVLSEVYGDGRPPSDLKNEIYFTALKQYSIDTLKHAIERMVTSRVFPSFPKPGEIIQEIEGAKEDHAVIAWVEVVGAIRRIGSYQSVAFADPTIHAVIEFMGGWPATGEWLEDDLKWKQREFERLYPIMKSRGCGKKYLPGICEISNGTHGYHGIDNPVLIGSECVKLLDVGAAISNSKEK